jgi:hypothetical protein
MSFGDPDMMHCTCGSRALRKHEQVIYAIPKKLPNGSVIYVGMMFDKDCPEHGYTKAEPVDKKE